MSLMGLLTTLSYIVMISVILVSISIVVAICGAYYFLRAWLNDAKGYKLPPRFKDDE